jgi:hypothetical protein
MNQMPEGIQPMRKNKLTMIDNTHTEGTESDQVIIHCYLNSVHHDPLIRNYVVPR